ncbi:serine hydrolase [Polaribacter sp.]|nr:serine hydrolase [Polaribacter sp.]
MKNILFFFFIGFTTFVCSQTTNPLLTQDFEKQTIWVDSIFNTLTLDEKIGQLFMVQAYSNKDQEHQQEIEKLITDYKIGSLIFMQGTPAKQAALTNNYQATAKIPLLIGFDGEWGLDMRLQNTYRFPWNMTLGAIENDTLLYNLGKRIGEQCNRIGIHINFAPVVDVNTNPKNPIIGNRSFGEDKENVSNKSIWFTKGMQDANVLACAKHFPGHGDTETDSHHKLPYLDFTRERLDSVELYPYKKLFANGVASVMTAHLNIPSFESKQNLPTSLSKNVVTNLLKNELGFKGLVITDGLNMKGAADYSSSAEVNLEALKAGNDMLLIPQDIPESIEKIKQAIANKNYPLAQLDASVKKVLQAKYWAGLHDYKALKVKDIVTDLNTIEDEMLHRKLLKNALTILKNDENLLPIKDLNQKNIAYVKLGDSQNEAFVEMLKNYTKVDVIDDKNIATLLNKLDKYNLVIIGFHTSNDHPWKSYKFTNKQLVWLQEVARHKQVILDVFASPYSLLQLKSIANINAILVSYQNNKLSQEISAQLLFGAFKSKGKLPVSIAPYFSEGYGIETDLLQRLSYGLPEEVGMSAKHLKLIDKMADTILKEKMTPGFQVLVAKNNQVIFNKSYGYFTDKKQRMVTEKSLYDVASLTKILATLPLIMKAEEDHKLKLSSTLADLLPTFKDSNKDSITVKEILSHVARLQSWIPFYTMTQDSVTSKNSTALYKTKASEKYNIKVAENLYLLTSYKDSIYKQIKEVDQRKNSGYKYSDLGYYLFKEFLEKTYKKPLNILADSMFYSALGMDRSTFLPLEKFKKKEIVPTEIDDYYRNQKIQGYVHDMGAAMLGGVGGHAGLFANANDIAKLMQLYLNNGFYGGKQFLQPETIAKFNQRYFENEEVRRGLGFDKPQLDPNIGSTCGCVSSQSFGHSGFTGTYTWADPESKIIYVFLSNRVYPTMKNTGLIKRNVRTKIQQIIQDANLD